MKTNPFKPYQTELLMIAAGAVIYAWSMDMIRPVSIIPGSVLGISVITHYLLGVPIGGVNLLINFPLLILGLSLLGRKRLVYTVIALISTSVLIDLWPFTESVPWIHSAVTATLSGGFTMGIGAGLLLRAGATMGGTSMLGRMIQIRHPHVAIGCSMLIMDSLIISCGAFLLNDRPSFFYSMLYTAVCMATIDVIQYDWS